MEGEERAAEAQAGTSLGAREQALTCYVGQGKAQRLICLAEARTARYELFMAMVVGNMRVKSSGGRVALRFTLRNVCSTTKANLNKK